MIQRAYARADTFAARGSALRASLIDVCVKASNGPAKVDVDALFTRRAGDDTFVAVDPSAGTALENPHPSAAGPLQNVATWASRYHDVDHQNSSARVVGSSGSIEQSFRVEPLSLLPRVERIPMVRLASAAPSPSVQARSGKSYEVRAYTIDGYKPLHLRGGGGGAADEPSSQRDAQAEADAYAAWLEAKIAPTIGGCGGRIAAFWMRCAEPAHVTSSGALAGGADGSDGAPNAADPVPDIVWVAEWGSRVQAAAWYATHTGETFAGNPYAPGCVPSRYKRIEVTWSDAHTVRPLIHSGVAGLQFDTRGFHTPKGA